jgi:hypothetical protein
MVDVGSLRSEGKAEWSDDPKVAAKSMLPLLAADG